MDPVLQFQPWLEFNRRMIRSGRLPLWNGHAGCGAPHLANGQSAVFDPFHLLAYLGTDAATPMPGSPRAGCGWPGWGCSCWRGRGDWASGDAGSRDWSIRSAASWSSGCLFPVTAVAIWMPWLFLATDRLFRRPGPRAAGWLAVVVALVIFGGHIQTSAHVLLAGGLYALARCWLGADERGRRAAGACSSGRWGRAWAWRLSAVQILPLGFYLAKSPVWSDRQRERPAWWVIDRPRLLDAVCTAVPYVYGSQRRGHPNLARALGVHNLNESAGGFAGLATLIWLAPLAVVTRGRSPQVAFLTGLVVFGAMGAFRWPPVDNLLRALPVLDVTDNRRLTLWVAFGLTLLGRDRSRSARTIAPLAARLARCSGSLAALRSGLVGLRHPCVRAPAPGAGRRPLSPGRSGDAGRRSGSLPAASRAPGAAGSCTSSLDTMLLVAVELGVLAALAVYVRRSGRCPVVDSTRADRADACSTWPCWALVSIRRSRREFTRYEPPVIARLRQGLPPGEPGPRAGRGAAAQRAHAVRPLPTCATTTRSSWPPAWRGLPHFTNRQRPRARAGAKSPGRGVIGARDRLLESGVGAIVAASPPPDGDFRSRRAGRARLDRLAGAASRGPTAESPRTPARAVRATTAGPVILSRCPGGRSARWCGRPGTRDGRRCSTANPSQSSQNRAFS